MKRRVQRVEILSKKEERSQLKKAFYLVIVSVIIAFFLFSFGIGVLSGFADVLNKIFNNDSENTNAKEPAQMPILDSLPDATSSSKLKVSGFAFGAKKVFFFVNGEKSGEAEVSADKFSFENLTLKEGINEINAKSLSSDQVESDFSKSYSVILDRTAPELTVESPSDGQTFSGTNRISVKGKTEKDAQVYAGGFLANVNPEGNFEVFVPLIEGDNEIEVKAIDVAGNINSEKIRVRFNR